MDGLKVFTYFMPIPRKDPAEELALIEVWKESWRARAWEPVVLDESDIPDDRESKQLMRAFRRQPTLLKPGLALASFARWLAVARQGGGFMCDYDVINYSFEPREVGEIMVYERHVPCLVSGTSEEFLRICGVFAGYRADHKDRIGWRKDTSDMKVLIRRPEVFRKCTECVEFQLPGWEAASAVHFSNFAMKPRGLMPRHEHIDKIRPFR